MRESSSTILQDELLDFPIRAELPKFEAAVLWGDNPELVLERLRQITGRREWWR
jgi:hypothetical protein